MTTIKTYPFSDITVRTLSSNMETNWPVVYNIYNDAEIYVGETTNLRNRLLQHSENPSRRKLEHVSVVFDDEYNKSTILDLESQLIEWFSADGKFIIQNANRGIQDHNYYRREGYRANFEKIWKELQKCGLAKQSVKEIENSGLFKFSPYKSLNNDQIRVVEEVLQSVEEATINDKKSISVIGGKEGTGKTIVLMYLIKLIRDIQDYDFDATEEYADESAVIDLYFKKPFSTRLKNKTMATVIPNQSLKGSVKKVFNTIGNMKSVQVLSPLEFAKCDKNFDVVFVDEAHLLKNSNTYSYQNAVDFNNINEKLGAKTELDWVLSKAKHVVLVYGDQRVRPTHVLESELFSEKNQNAFDIRSYALTEQMRSRGGTIYIDYLEKIFSFNPPQNKEKFEGFELKMFTNFRSFVEEIRKKNGEVGLSRLVAGFAWKWESKKDKSRYDITIDGIRLRWNSSLDDWAGRAECEDEVGSIYTIQGFDLNYCGVIIGNDLKFDECKGEIVLNRENYFDTGAKRRSSRQIKENIQLDDDELLDQIKRIYRILMNRSVLGTYVYVCDQALRRHLSKYFDVVG